MTRILDALAFSSLWVAAAAMSLAAASSRSFGARPRVALLAFVFAGTLAVYSVDRLRDVARDRLTAPVRSVWVERHRKGIAGMAAIAALLAGICGIALGPVAIATAAVAGGLGAFHRRMKHVPFAKALYVSAAWVAVTVVLPAALARPLPSHPGSVVRAGVSTHGSTAKIRFQSRFMLITTHPRAFASSRSDDENVPTWVSGSPAAGP